MMTEAQLALTIAIPCGILSIILIVLTVRKIKTRTPRQPVEFANPTYDSSSSSLELWSGELPKDK